MVIVGSAILIFLVGVAIGLKIAELTYIKAMEEADEEIDEMIDKFVQEEYERERSREKESLGQIH